MDPILVTLIFGDFNLLSLNSAGEALPSAVVREHFNKIFLRFISSISLAGFAFLFLNANLAGILTRIIYFCN